MFENDWIQRQIEVITRSLAMAIFHKDLPVTIAEESVFNENMAVSGDNMIVPEEDMLIYMLLKYTNERKLNEAENYLFKALEDEPSENMVMIGLGFYDNLQSFSDDELAACDFSREEIERGIADMAEFM
ncbi:MAG: DUF6483 family protein [Defluviitaleaceae bacterium]|nr:DUF6483 family protein [Defluviitaleaceae bacterium]